MRRLIAVSGAVLFLCFTRGLTAQQDDFPPGGFTPVFNEVTIALAITPDRPAPDAKLEDIAGITERVLMVNRIDDETKIVQPTIFIRSDTVLENGRRTQLLQLAHDSGIASSKIFGGELTMYVRPPIESAVAVKSVVPNFPPIATSTFLNVPPDAAMPERVCLGKIQSVEPGRAFPARVHVPVY